MAKAGMLASPARGSKSGLGRMCGLHQERARERLEPQRPPEDRGGAGS
jgi:hypothetical protein